MNIFSCIPEFISASSTKMSDVVGYKKFYLKDEMADVFIIFGNEQPPERVPAHKFLLGYRSDVFKTMFYGEMK